MESDYVAGLLGRPDLSSTLNYYYPATTPGNGGSTAVLSGSVNAQGVGTGQASLTLAGVLVVFLMVIYGVTRGRQH